MAFTIPLTSDPSQTFSIELAGDIYQFRVIYNQRYGTWSFDLSDVDDVLLVAGIPLLIGSDLLSQYNLEIGALVVIDTEETFVDATGDDGDLGTRVILTYITPEELEAGALAS